MLENEFKKISLEDLGYVPFFATNRNKLGLDSFPVARVVSELKEAYKVRNTEGEYFGKWNKKHLYKIYEEYSGLISSFGKALDKLQINTDEDIEQSIKKATEEVHRDEKLKKLFK